MLALILSIAALVVGPVAHAWVHDRPAPMALLEGFIVTAIGGMVLVHIIPHSIHLGGWLALAVALLGVLGPAVVERMFHHSAGRKVHALALAVALLGVGAHAFLDGLALAASSAIDEAGGNASGVAVAVVLHNIPVGLTVWWLLRHPHGASAAIGVLALMAASTAGGFFAGPRLLAALSGRGLGLFQALVAGSLVHVVLHRPEHHHHGESGSRWSLAAVAGAAVGLLLVLAISLFEG